MKQSISCYVHVINFDTESGSGTFRSKKAGTELVKDISKRFIIYIGFISCLTLIILKNAMYDNIVF